MPRWRLEYYIGTPHYPRSVEADFDDLLGENISQAHDFIRKISEEKGDLAGEATLRWATLVVDPEYGRDPLEGEPTIPLWITYVPWHPDDDPDDKSRDTPPVREKFEFPARNFETRLDAKGAALQDGPSLGTISLAIRRRLADGREGTILKVDDGDEV
jgi:hypothetical protein